MILDDCEGMNEYLSDNLCIRLYIVHLAQHTSYVILV